MYTIINGNGRGTFRNGGGCGETDRQTDRQTETERQRERERSLNHYPAKRFVLLMRMRFRLTEFSQSTVVKPMMMMMS